MQLTQQIGLRARYSPAEVRAQLGFTTKQLRTRVLSGVLKKRFGGRHPFAQKDVNEFIVRFNAGEVD